MFKSCCFFCRKDLAGMLILIRQCGHTFHWHCLANWKDKGNATCPLDDSILDKEPDVFHMMRNESSVNKLIRNYFY